MSLKKQMVLAAVLIALVAGVIILSTPKKASAVGQLEYDWFCSPPDGVCDFTVTTNNHPKVFWNWGDGTTTGPTTSMTAQHDYAVGGGGTFFTVSLAGYATVGSGSPDNIIACDDIEAQGASPGGNPGAGGHCDGTP